MAKILEEGIGWWHFVGGESCQQRCNGQRQLRSRLSDWERRGRAWKRMGEREQASVARLPSTLCALVPWQSLARRERHAAVKLWSRSATHAAIAWLKPPPSPSSNSLTSWWLIQPITYCCRATRVLQLFLKNFGQNRIGLHVTRFQRWLHWNWKFSLSDSQNFGDSK
jgi:hypothetical protein